MCKKSDFGWEVETVINDRSVNLINVNGNVDYNIRSLVQQVTAPDGSKIILTQELDNNGDYCDIRIESLVKA